MSAPKTHDWKQTRLKTVDKAVVTVNHGNCSVCGRAFPVISTGGVGGVCMGCHFDAVTKFHNKNPAYREQDWFKIRQQEAREAREARGK